MSPCPSILASPPPECKSGRGSWQPAAPRLAAPAAHPCCLPASCPSATLPWIGDKLKQLIALRTSARYLDRLAAGLQHKAGQEAKFLRWVGLVSVREHTALFRADALVPYSVQSALGGQSVASPVRHVANAFRLALMPQVAFLPLPALQGGCGRGAEAWGDSAAAHG